MKFSITIIIIVFFTLTQAISQKLNIFYGVELTQTRFRQYAPLVTVPFENPHMPGYGISTNFTINYQFNKNISTSISPLISFNRTNSNVTDDYQLNVFGFRTNFGYRLNNFQIDGGLEFNKLHSIIGTLPSGKIINWTFFAHRRNLWGPNININYYVAKSLCINLRSTYFLRDFFSSGALDYNGDIVGPVEVTPFVLAVGVNYSMTDAFKRNKEKREKK